MARSPAIGPSPTRAAINIVDVAPDPISAEADTVTPTTESKPLSFDSQISLNEKLAQVGFDLAKTIMWMMGGAITILVLMLLLAESGERDRSSKIIDQAMAIAIPSSAAIDDKRLTGVMALLRQSASDPKLVLPPVESANAKTLIDESLKIASITDEQRKSLDGKCIPVPAASVKDRSGILEGCAATLETLYKPKTSLEQRLAFISGLQKSLGDEQAKRHAFWLQAAQLILINLLLPILTALLGYIFGTQQAK